MKANPILKPCFDCIAVLICISQLARSNVKWKCVVFFIFYFYFVLDGGGVFGFV